ncbi:MAG: response regulator, partial [Cyanobacteria bacterium J06560_2]
LPDLASGADHGFSPALVPAQPVPAQPVPGSQVLSPQRPRKNASGGLGAKPAVRGLSDVPTKVIPPRSKSPKSVQQRTVQQRTVQQHISSKPLFRASVKKKAESSKNSISPNVVYIDDSPADSRTMAQVVEGLGCRYTNIADPIQALPILLELNPDLIFLDLVMPVANGYEVCSQIRRISALKKTPVIIVTSNDGVADRVRARLVGASGFLGKPIRSEKVAKVLKKHVAGFRPHASVKPMQKPTEKGKSTQENTQKNVPKNTQEGAQKSAPESTPENTQRVGASLISR